MPDDPKPAQSTTLAPGAGIVSSALVGTPLAVVTVSLLNRTVFEAHPLTVEEAVAFGTTGAVLLGYLFHVAEVILNRHINR